MYLGYQDGKIAFVGDTEEELKNLPCVVLDEIVYTSDTYILHNGEYVKEEDIDPNDEVIANRQAAYPSVQEQLDLLYWDKINGTNDWADKITEIKTTYPKVETKESTNE